MRFNRLAGGIREIGCAKRDFCHEKRQTNYKLRANSPFWRLFRIVYFSGTCKSRPTNLIKMYEFWPIFSYSHFVISTYAYSLHLCNRIADRMKNVVFIYFLFIE